MKQRIYKYIHFIFYFDDVYSSSMYKFAATSCHSLYTLLSFPLSTSPQLPPLPLPAPLAPNDLNPASLFE